MPIINQNAFESEITFGIKSIYPNKINNCLHVNVLRLTKPSLVHMNQSQSTYETDIQSSDNFYGQKTKKRPITC